MPKEKRMEKGVNLNKLGFALSFGDSANPADAGYIGPASRTRAVTKRFLRLKATKFTVF